MIVSIREEKTYESCKRFYDAGVDRYLLRHETANPEALKHIFNHCQNM